MREARYFCDRCGVQLGSPASLTSFLHLADPRTKPDFGVVELCSSCLRLAFPQLLCTDQEEVLEKSGERT